MTAPAKEVWSILKREEGVCIEQGRQCQLGGRGVLAFLVDRRVNMMRSVQGGGRVEAE